MYLKILINYILGYLNIVVEGYYIERFMNLCISKQIFLWKTKKDKSTILHANIGITDYFRINKLLKETKCRAKIINKKGLPFIFNKYKKRKFVLGVLLFFCLLLFIMSNFVWNIDIEGLDKIKQEEILSMIKDDGLSIGMAKYKIDTSEIINKMRLERQDIAWVGIEIKGTNAIVKIVEANSKPEMINQEEQCSIVSNKEAMIVKAVAKNGTVLVEEGQIVKKGTTLIGGWMQGKFTDTRFVHAEGDILGKVWYTEKVKVDMNYVERNRTGKEEKKYAIKINNFQINLNKRVSKFQKYDTMNENKKLKIFSNLYLPFELVKQTNYEVIENEKTLRNRGGHRKRKTNSRRKINEPRR